MDVGTAGDCELSGRSACWSIRGDELLDIDNSFNCTKQILVEQIMAENSAGIGVMGVVVGALVVGVVGTGLLFATGTIGSNTSTVKIDLPKVTVK